MWWNYDTRARRLLEYPERHYGRQDVTVDIAPIMKSCGYDWLFLDLEHNSMDLDTAVQIAVAALGAGIAPVARVPARQLWMATRFLDGGGLGIVMPHVDTPEEAREIAQALRYPPHGHRSVAGGLPHFGYERLSLAETCSAINAATLVVVMLETPRAIENAAAIAAVPGIDSLLIGPNDLAMELGIPGAFGDERIESITTRQIAAWRTELARGGERGRHTSNKIDAVAHGVLGHRVEHEVQQVPPVLFVDRHDRVVRGRLANHHLKFA